MTNVHPEKVKPQQIKHQIMRMIALNWGKYDGDCQAEKIAPMRISIDFNIDLKTLHMRAESVNRKGNQVTIMKIRTP